MKRTLGKKNDLNKGMVVAFACNCVGGICNIGCSCTGTTDYTTTYAQNLAKVVSSGMQLATWS
ncbi:MAG: hypothetical protein HFJ09_11040 [Lachnospiraceae bacterium]|nr:hypothetical protein [Lachnospiraceae bacterium]